MVTAVAATGAIDTLPVSRANISIPAWLIIHTQANGSNSSLQLTRGAGHSAARGTLAGGSRGQLSSNVDMAPFLATGKNGMRSA